MGLVQLGVLVHASAAEASSFLADSDAAALVAAVRETPDAELRRIVDRDEVRGVATDLLLQRIGEFVIADQLAGVAGTVRLEIRHEGRVDVVRGLTIGDGAIVPTRDAPETADVRLETGAVDLIRLISGERNAGLEYLAGRLVIAGDADLALALGGMFPAAGVEGADPVPVDPRALDPVEVARVLHGVDTGHLRSVMASGFRQVVLDEIFTRLPEFVNQQRASGHDLTIGFRLTGRDDEQVDRYVISLAGGTATVLAGEEADAVGRDARDATVTCAAHDFLRLATGHLGAVTGVLKGQLKVRGDKAKALRLATAFDIPSVAA